LLENPEKMKTIRITVSGRVQGVYYRAFVQKLAIKYGITGFARNKSDGSVEIIASAEQKKLDPFIAGCHKGPMLAKVSQVLVNDTATSERFAQFEIR
jgi:acylphosphatase